MLQWRQQSAKGTASPSPTPSCATADCHMQMTVSEIAASVSLDPFLALVGQGMRVVVTGAKLAGALAHAVAARLLLTLHRDLAAALAQGIKLSDSFLKPKVSAAEAAKAARGAPVWRRRGAHTVRVLGLYR